MQITRYTGNFMGCPVPLAKWQVRALEAMADRDEDRQAQEAGEPAAPPAPAG